MRCEDCLPLVEEYFDGEVGEGLAARMGAHLAACETCAAALDALSLEQEVYLRYDRGLEVTPDLWSRVSAEIARAPRAENAPAPRPLPGGWRERFAAALGALTARPALASSLALLLVAAAAGSLWLSRRSPDAAPAEVAQNFPAAAPAPPPQAGGVVETPDPSLNVEVRAEESPAQPGPGREEPREAAAVRAVNTNRNRADAAEDAETLLARATAPQANLDSGIVELAPEEHAAADDTALFVSASAPVGERVAAAAGGGRLLDPGEKEVARHLEQTQMLLRSIKNSPAAGTAAVDVAYERGLSRRLLAENATLKLEAEVKGDKETREVLDRIEPFLLDIANLRDRPSRDEVRSIGERVRKNEIVAALQVY